MFIKLRPILSFLILLLLIDVFIDPSNKILSAKYLLFIGVFAIWFIMLLAQHRTFHIPHYLLYLVIFMSVFMPFYGLLRGITFNTINNNEIGQFLYYNSFFFFLLILVLQLEKIDLAKTFNNSALIIALITFCTYLIFLLKPGIFSDVYDFFVKQKGAATFSIRNFGGINFLMFYYKTSPILVFPLSYYLFKTINEKSKHVIINIIVIIFVSISLFLSGTRANILSLLLILIFYTGYYIHKKSKTAFYLGLIISFVLLLIFVPIIAQILFDRQDYSNQVKFGHANSYLELFENSFVFLFGHGLGSSFYSEGTYSEVLNSELTYFELIRVWGLPISLVFVFNLMLPIFIEIYSRRITSMFIAYLAYLFICGTNPLLLSSTGMIVLVYVFNSTLRNYKINISHAN